MQCDDHVCSIRRQQHLRPDERKQEVWNLCCNSGGNINSISALVLAFDFECRLCNHVIHAKESTDPCRRLDNRMLTALQRLDAGSEYCGCKIFNTSEPHRDCVVGRL